METNYSICRRLEHRCTGAPGYCAHGTWLPVGPPRRFFGMQPILVALFKVMHHETKFNMKWHGEDLFFYPTDTYHRYLFKGTQRLFQRERTGTFRKPIPVTGHPTTHEHFARCTGCRRVHWAGDFRWVLVPRTYQKA